ncbi:hypothetical protein N0V90_000191 [Kalmusia sp. IMI 367209]|nr:hypothetical protein N0V90_000191 [Kalmusia sp. IMI 367209]
MAEYVTPAPFKITDDDKRGLIVVTAAYTVAFVWVCFIIRVWLRLQVKDWKAEDCFLGAATFMNTLQTGLVFHLVSLGLGGPQEEIPLHRLAEIGKHGFASQIFYILTLWATKTSVLFLYKRLSPSGGHKVATSMMLASSAIWALLAIILICVPCNPTQFFANRASECIGIWPKWQAITALDIVIEGCIFIIAVHLVWPLRMRWKAKLMVLFAFSAQLPIIMIAALRLHYFHAAIADSNFTHASSFYLVANQWQMSYAIISLMLIGMGPFLRPFNEDLQTSYIAKRYVRHGDITVSRSGGSQLRSYEMKRLDGTEVSAQVRVTMTNSRSRNEPKAPSPGSGRISPTSQTSIIRSTEPPTFRPQHEGLRHDAEVWHDNRTSSVQDTDDVFKYTSDETRLVITKRTEMKVETASIAKE